MMVHHFGPLPDPTLDGHDQIHIVFAPLTYDASGYFYAGDLHPSAPHSNCGRYIYINSVYIQRATADVDYYVGIMLHELQHMQFYHTAQRYGLRHIPSWVSEGLSELAADLAGYGFTNRVDFKPYTFLKAPDKASFMVWQHTSAHYGGAYLFWRYIYDRFGLRAIYEAPRGVDPIANLERATGRSFDSLFEDWAITLWVYPRGLSDNPAYAYDPSETPRSLFILDGGKGAAGRVVYPLPSNRSPVELHPYAPVYIDVTGGQGQARVTGGDAVGIVMRSRF